MNGEIERQFDAVLNEPAIFLAILGPDGTLLRTNRTALSFADLDRSMVEGNPFPETPWWDDDPTGRERLRRAIERAADGDSDRFETVHVGSDGEEIVLDVTIRPVTDETGSVTELIAEGRDVTERTRRGEAMAALHEATRTLLAERSAYGIAAITVETARDVLDLAHAAVSLYDERDGQLRPVGETEPTGERIGSTPSVEPGEGVIGYAYEHDTEIVLDDAPSDDRWLDRREDEIRSYVVRPLADHGVFAVASPEADAIGEYDLTLARTLAANVEVALDRAQRENRLARQTDRLEGLANALSHDLRNSLNVAQGHLQLADYEDDHTAVAANALDRMETFIDDALTLIERGELLEETAVVELHEIAEEAWKNTETEGTLRAADPPLVVADPGRLCELLEHVFENVGKYCPPTVSIELGSLSDGFYVADDGPGWTGDLDRVFDAGYSTRSDHTGLGLTIVQRIADAHGWMVAATNAETGGARIEFTGIETVADP